MSRIVDCASRYKLVIIVGSTSSLMNTDHYMTVDVD